jgi:GGDEF domain-containing protein
VGDGVLTGLNAAARPADSQSMTTAPNTPPLAASPGAAVADVTTLLPSRRDVLRRLAEQLSAVGGATHTLMVIGLLRRDDGWPTAQSTLARVTTLLAGSLRGDDFLGKSGPGEWAVVLTGPVTAAETAATRLLAAVPTLGIPGLTAAAGIAPLSGDADADEVLRRALASLTAARRAGAGTVIRHREPY